MAKARAKLTPALTVPEICAMLRTSRVTVYNLIERGDLAAYKVGPYWRVDEEDLQRYKERGKQAARTLATQTEAT